MSKKNRKSSRVISIVAIVTGLSLLGDSMLYIALPIYWEQVGLESLWQIGILLSINRFIRLPINPVVGWIYKRISIKTGLLIAIIIGALTTLGYGFLKGFIAWIILRALWGVAWSFFRIGGLTCVAYYAEEEHLGKAMGTYTGIYRLGSLVGLLFGGLLAPIIGLDKVAILFGIVTSIGIPIIMIALKNDYASQMDDRKSKLQKSVSSPFFNRMLIVFICLTGLLLAMLFQGVLTSTLSSVIEHYYGREISLFQVVISAALLSGIIQAIRWLWEPFLARWVGHLSDGPHGRKPIFIFSLFYAGSVYWIISLDLQVSIWIWFTFGVLVGATTVSTLSDALALDIAKSSSNTVSLLTIYSITQDLGAALGPFISYMVIEMESGYTYLYLGGTLVLLFLAVIWLVIATVEKRYVQRTFVTIAK